MSVWFQRLRALSVGVACVAAAIASATTGGCLDEVPLRSRILVSLVESVCDTACGCGRSSCEAWAAEQTEAVEFLVETHDLHFDDECFEQRLQQHASAGCRPVVEADPDRCGFRCRLLYGDREAGQSCEWFPRGGSDCAQELECVAGRCVDPCDVSAQGVACDPEFECPPPTTCNVDTGLCMARPGQDEPCVSGICQPELSCVGGVCTGPRELGEPCQGHSGCRSGSCPAGFCAPKPGPGDPCQPLVPCADGRICEDGRCVAAGGAGDPCPCNETGGISMLCSNGRCEYANPGQCGGAFVIE